MQLAGLPDFYRNLVKGAVLPLAVGFDTYQGSTKDKKTIAKMAGGDGGSRRTME
jgi:hypothetical protein